jgi:hypothetical protein
VTTFVFDERFAAGFFHDPCRRVFGRRLQPFSYWHKVQLEYVQSAFLTGETPGKWDVWVASRILATRYPVAAQLRGRYPSWWYLGWYGLYGWRSLARGVRGIIRHINDFSSGPKFWPKGGSYRRLADAYRLLAREMGDRSLQQKAAHAERQADLEEAGKRDVDDSVEQVSIYMKYAGRPAVEAWNMPLGELLWHNACFLKMEGAEVPIWSPTDEAFFEQHKKQRHLKLLELGAEKQKENPTLTQSLAFALASVEYWEGIVDQKKASVGKR